MSEYDPKKVTRELIRRHFRDIDNMEHGQTAAIMSTILSCIETLKNNKDSFEYDMLRNQILKVLLTPKPDPKCKYFEV